MIRLGSKTRARRGFALASLLLLVSALGVLALMVCATTTMDSHLTGSRVSSEQAFYAAEAAVQEAIWLIRSNPSYVLAHQDIWIPPVPRQFGDGFDLQYRVVRLPDGIYRVEGRSEGASARSTATRYYDPASSGGPGLASVMLCYGREPQPRPHCRFYEAGGWSAEEKASDTGAPPYWVVAASCPIREEKTVATVSSSGQLSAQVRSSWGWTAATPVASLNVSTRGFDVAYETLNGRALLVYAAGPASLGYAVWNGTTWGGPTSLSLPTSGTPRWVRLAANPKSNEIALAWATDAGGLGGAVWDGAAFVNATILSEALRTSDHECFALAYETQRGRALAVWQTGSTRRIIYCLWNGSAWGAGLTGPDVHEEATYIRAGADPASNSIMLGTLDAHRDINVWVWDGSAWGDHQEESGAQTTTQRCFDLSFGYPGGGGLFVWGKGGASKLKYRRWIGKWEGAKDGPVVGTGIGLVQLAPDAYSQRLFAQVENGAFELLSASWDGSAWDGPTTIETILPGAGAYEPFMLTSGYSSYGVIYRTAIDADDRDAVSVNNSERIDGLSVPNPHCRFGAFTAGADVYQSGLEFRLNIPKTAIIKEAYITLTSDDVNQTGWEPTGPFTAHIAVMEKDDALPFSPLHSHDMLHHAPYWNKTAAWSVPLWEPLVQYRTPNLAELVQHLMARGGWSSGNYIGFVIDEGDATGSSFRSFKDFGDAPGQAAKLTVIYSLP